MTMRHRLAKLITRLRYQRRVRETGPARQIGCAPTDVQAAIIPAIEAYAMQGLIDGFVMPRSVPYAFWQARHVCRPVRREVM